MTTPPSQPHASGYGSSLPGASQLSPGTSDSVHDSTAWGNFQDVRSPDTVLPPPTDGVWRVPEAARYQPGFVPLRPLTLSDVLTVSFRIIRENPKSIFGLTLFLMGGALLLTIVLGGAGFFAIVGAVSQFSADDGTAALSAVALGSAVFLVVSSILMFSQAVLQGGLSQLVAHNMLRREKPTMRDLWVYAKPRRWSIVFASLWIGLVVAIAIAAFIGMLFGFIMLADTLPVGLEVFALLLMGAVGYVGVLLFVLKFVFAVPVIALENVGAFEGIRRSWTLTNKGFWRLAGVFFIVSLVANIATSILGMPFQFMGALLFSLATASGLSDTGPGVMGVLGMSVIYAGVFFSAVMVMPFQIISFCLMYLDHRMRYEALDAQLLEQFTSEPR